ncbi:hypothetical protein [Lysinibacillus telephonicus]
MRQKIRQKGAFALAGGFEVVEDSVHSYNYLNNEKRHYFAL